METNDKTPADPSLVSADAVLAPLMTARDVPAPPPLPPGDAIAVPSGGLMDQHGIAWNGITDATPARLNAKGSWCKKGGNGARKAKGLGFVVPTAKDGPRSPRLDPVVNDQLTAGETAAGVDAVPVIGLTVDDYKATGEGITRGIFAALKLAFGKAWEPDPAELNGWQSYTTRLWAHYQWPRLGLIPEGCVLLFDTIQKRCEDVKTLGMWNATLTWLGIKKRQPVDPAASKLAA